MDRIALRQISEIVLGQPILGCGLADEPAADHRQKRSESCAESRLDEKIGIAFVLSTKPRRLPRTSDNRAQTAMDGD